MYNKSEFLFVYGTLRASSAHPMARLLAAHARYFGPAQVPGRLYDVGHYPGMIGPAAVGEWVCGDLYELPQPATVLPQLDRYEGCHPDDGALYERCLLKVTRDTGESAWAWVYLYRLPVEERWRIPSGKYGA